MLHLQAVFERHLPAVLASRALPAYMRRAAKCVLECRTANMGSHLRVCPAGHHREVVHNSCRHRCCPFCGELARAQWLDAWSKRLLPCPHHHIVFTLPHELLPLWRYNKRAFAGILFRAASQALRVLLNDPQFLGAKPGVLAALHTWGQNLSGHVHLHVLVTAGGVTAEGQWAHAKRNCLLPRKVLMVMFRGKFRALLLEKLSELHLPPNSNKLKWQNLLNRLGRTLWNVKLLERYDHGTGVLKYLARYLRGGPISPKRLLWMDDQNVRFRYRLAAAHGEPTRHSTMQLTGEDFIMRWLEHVPPKGFHTVRGYGLYSGNQHSQLPLAHELLGSSMEPQERLTVDDYLEELEATHPCSCPVCGRRLLIIDPRRPARRMPAPRAPPKSSIVLTAS